MASAIRSSCQISARTVPITSTLRLVGASRPAAAMSRQAFRRQAQRTYASQSSSSSSSSSSSRQSNAYKIMFRGGFGAVAAGTASYLYFSSKSPEPVLKLDAPRTNVTKSSPVPKVRSFEDYRAVYDALAERLEEYDEYEDGSFGPVVLRLAWHCSGTYDAATGTGGSNGATMRFDPESDHGANNGLHVAREFLEPIKEQFPWISYSDLWTLAGVCAIQEMQGPSVPWRPGRADRDRSWCTPDGRLPDGSKKEDHLRTIFGRMGFDDREIVALSGAHALGRCHTDRSGFEGPWTFSPTVVTNEYYRLLMDEKWKFKEWDGPRQYEDVSTKSLMMLPTDMALIQDPNFLPYVKKYADDSDAFFEDFSGVLCKLFELGVPFQSTEEDRFTFRPKVAE